MADISVNTLVIGAGPGGYVAAIRLGQLGVKTVLVEKEKRPGGVCLNWGCIPSKSLIQMAKSYDNTLGFNKKMGIEVDKVSINWEKTQKWKNNIITTLSKGIAHLLKGNGVEYVEGTACLTGKNTAEVTTAQGKKTIAFENAIIATGSSIRSIPGFTIDHQYIVDSTDLLELKEIPKSLTLIGGGVIGLELGTVYAKLGTKVTVIEVMDQLLPGLVSSDVAVEVTKKLKKHKVDIFLGARAKSWKKENNQTTLVFEYQGKEETITSDIIGMVVGRTPNSKGFGAETLGIKTTPQGFFEVNDRLQTSVANIYAIGDVAGPPMLAHKASKDAEIAAEIIHGTPCSTEDIQAIANVIFTDPEIATVGLTEDQAKAKNLKINVGKFPYAALAKAKFTGETEGFTKIISEAESELILGVEIVGSHASDLISEAGLAVEMSATLDDIGLTVHPHPTLGEIMMEAAKAAKGAAVHMLNK